MSASVEEPNLKRQSNAAKGGRASLFGTQGVFGATIINKLGRCGSQKFNPLTHSYNAIGTTPPFGNLRRLSSAAKGGRASLFGIQGVFGATTINKLGRCGSRK